MRGLLWILCLIAFVAPAAQNGGDDGRDREPVGSCEVARRGVSRSSYSYSPRVRVMDEELERFKHYDLRGYAATFGFVIDVRASSRGSTVMRRDGEKIVISRKADGHWTYWSPHDDADR